MCVILDVNNALEVLLPDRGKKFEPIRRSLANGKARLVAGGKLTREYTKSGAILRLFNELARAGKARVVDDKKVDQMTSAVVAEGKCKSDDEHIIALARVSGARLLCTGDNALKNDFTDSKILGPKGNIFAQKNHAHLIRKHCGTLGN